MSAGPSLAELTSPTPALYTIAPGRGFLDDLAGTLLASHKGDPAGLADVTVFLPTRRAARALADAFLRAAGPSPAATLLPHIRTLGDLGEDEALDTMPEAMDLPPPIEAASRRLTLARLVFQRQQAEAAGEHAPAASWTTALSAADELCGLLDSFYTEEVSFDALADLVPERFADHWQRSLDFLKIVTETWPSYLSATGHLDPAEHRRRTIDALAAAWNPAADGTPPRGPVIIAGSTGSMPAVARLMALVATLPQGAVILPGLDTSLDAAAWGQIDDPHPQAGLKLLLERHFPTVTPADIPAWPAPDSDDPMTERRGLLTLALRPAEATGDWLEQLEKMGNAHVAAASKGLSLVEAPDEEAEAQAIAIALREVLETPERTAVLVTPDRQLARRVSARLARWGIALDDSAGVPFANTPRGNFLRLVAAWLEAPHDPLSLMAMLKHPLCRAGLPASDYYPAVTAMDFALRGQPPGTRFDALIDRLRHAADWDALSMAEDNDEPVHAPGNAPADGRYWPIIEPLADRLSPLAGTLEEAGPSLQGRLSAHLEVAQILASRDDLPGEDILWSREDGEAGATLTGRLLTALADLPSANETSYTDVFTALIAGTPVRPRGGAHPRLRILGPLEARLQRADLVILGGLNEGVWPDEQSGDPFLSRPMRRALGLPSPERQVGLAAHDFAQLAAAPAVLLTRARRAGRAPARPSRWIVRLKNVLLATGLIDTVDETPRLMGWASAIDHAGPPQPARAPKPCPPLEDRPTHLSVTAVEKLLRDPYGIYARYILGLKKLEPLSRDINNALKGRFYHHLFARFVLEHRDTLPDNPVRVLTSYADELFDRAGLAPAVRAFWHTRMADSFDWFAGWEAARRAEGTPAVIEGHGSTLIDAGDLGVTLTARADRIDRLHHGSTMIYDYKTGTVPTVKQAATFSPQLQLTGLILERGGFNALEETRLGGFGFIKVLNRKGDKDDTVVIGDEAREKMVEAEEGLVELLSWFSDPDTPYLSQPRPFYRNDYGDFDHLARRGEWAVSGGDDE